MLNIFTLANGRLVQEEIESLEDLSRFQPIWVDLESPTLDEKRWIKQYYGLSIPEDAMDEDIEESARFYEEDNGELHIRSDFLIADDEEPRAVRVAFILNLQNTTLKSHGVLFSIHDEDVPVFRLLRMRARRGGVLALGAVRQQQVAARLLRVGLARRAVLELAAHGRAIAVGEVDRRGRERLRVRGARARRRGGGARLLRARLRCGSGFLLGAAGREQQGVRECDGENEVSRASLHGDLHEGREHAAR